GGAVTLDGGKDAWEADGEARGAFVAVAAAIADAARALGATSEPSGLRFVQLGLDAVDVPAARATWRAILAAEDDPREGVTDVVDPLGIGHVLLLQGMDAGEHERRAQRPRVRLDVHVPPEALEARLDAIVAAGGRVLEQHGDRTIVADQGGAIVTFVTA
ncbi:VOC family protein, partial [Agrococcus versicolor]